MTGLVCKVSEGEMIEKPKQFEIDLGKFVFNPIIGHFRVRLYLNLFQYESSKPLTRNEFDLHEMNLYL